MNQMLLKFKEFFDEFKSFESHNLRDSHNDENELVCSMGSFKGVFMSPFQKGILTNAVLCGIQRSFICKYLDINRQRVSHIVNQTRVGDDVVRPHKLDQIALDSLSTKMISLKAESSSAIKRSCLVELIQEGARETDMRKGGNGLGCEIIDSRTISQLMKDSGLTLNKGQVQSKARCLAS